MTLERIRALWICLGMIPLLGACGSDDGMHTGSGHIVTRNVPVTSFSGIEVASAFQVNVSFGAQEALTLRVDDDLVDQVDATVSEGRLHLGLKPGTKAVNATLSADVTARSLSRIGLSSGAIVHLNDKLTGRELKLTASGTGEFDGTLNVDQGEVTLSGGSHARASGDVGRLVLRQSGASRLVAEPLKVRDLDAEISGASLAAITVTSTLSAQLRGASSLRYRGSPRFLRQEISGASSVKPL